MANLKEHLRHWERIKNSNYNNFLDSFIVSLGNQDQRWYGKLDIVNKLISDTLALATQKKITNFTTELVDEIMTDEGLVQDLFQRVSALEQSNSNEYSIFIDKSLEFNQFNKNALELLANVSLDCQFDKYY